MTYSIIAHDPANNELGIDVQSRHFAVGRIVPWIEAGVGVVASQSFANPIYGYETLRRLRSGQEPKQILEQLLSEDAGASMRQVAILDIQGRMAVHTGTNCVAAAGHAVGMHCCAQANMMAQPTVWQAMVSAFENTDGQLADRLLAALEGAEDEGGNILGRQSAALIVVSGKSSGINELDHLVDLRVDDSPDPLGEIKRLLRYARAHQLADQGINKVMMGEVATGLADLEECCAEFPDEPEFQFRRALPLLLLGQVDEARMALQKAYIIHSGWSKLLLRFADAGIIPVSREKLGSLVSDLA